MAKVKGEPMKDASLLDGDMVLVQKNCPTKVGDIVVAEVDSHITMKYLRQQAMGASNCRQPTRPSPTSCPRASSRFWASLSASSEAIGGDAPGHICSAPLGRPPSASNGLTGAAGGALPMCALHGGHVRRGLSPAKQWDEPLEFGEVLQGAFRGLAD